ncbi:MAG: uracil-DNA glycosylase [Sulfitobacter sp.]
MESAEYYHAVELLRWQVELGADEAICDAPVDSYALPDKLAKPAAPQSKSKRGAAPPPPIKPVEVDVVGIAAQAARTAETLEALQTALSGFEHCDLKRGARKMVFSDGTPGARVMVIAEAPNREEDRAGTPFVGPAGQLFDRMFGAIEMGRTNAEAPIYVTNILPWRPPQDRDPRPDEIEMIKPFLLRHIALAKPQVLVLMGNWACQTLLGKRGITRLRGQWAEVAGLPAMPMFHPAYLLRSPVAKREAWADLLAVKAKLDG